jgi:hypothetical protein
LCRKPQTERAYTRTLKQEGFGPDDYNLIMRNCQHYIDALRRSVLISGRAPQE